MKTVLERCPLGCMKGRNKEISSLPLAEPEQKQGQSEVGSSFSMALQKGSQQVWAGMLAGSTECALARLFGPGTWRAMPPGMQPWVGRSEKEELCALERHIHVSEWAAVRVGMFAQAGTTEKEAAQDLYKKLFPCQQPLQSRERELYSLVEQT